MENLNQKTQELYSELYKLEDRLTELEFEQDMFDSEEDDEYWYIQEEIDEVQQQINTIHNELIEN